MICHPNKNVLIVKRAHLHQCHLTVETDMPSSSYIVGPSDRHEQEVHGHDFVLEAEPTVTPNKNRSPTNNFVGKELQSALKPINMMQAVFFCAKYKIRGNMITKNSIFYNIMSVLSTFTFTCCCYFFTLGFSFSDDVTGFQYIQHWARIYVYLVLVTGNLLNCWNNIIQQNNNIVFIKKIQAVFTNLNINDHFKRFICSNWMNVLIVNFYHFAWMIFSYFVIDFMGFGFTFTNQIWITLDVNILYATRIMKLLTKPLKSWVKNVKMSGLVEISEIDGYWETMFEVYLEILEAYKLFGIVFDQLVHFNKCYM